MHGDVFAEGVSITDAQSGGFIPILEILRGIANDRAGVEDVSGADGRVTRQVDMWSELTVRPDRDVFINDRKGANTGR